ncbi:MAG: PspC domain-containing protein [Melioribacter sp.]|uniref:PspC domain-containing protein n=1 Tax=Rosettibacter primus TaxID=3111523 RepID=UPI00247C8438|nr:PspC domain-containing protein [Melioribacter sp.]
MQKKLYRSRKFRVLGGVAGGLAEYFGLDPILMRVIFVLFTLINGIGVLLYIIFWIIIPEEPFEVAYNFDKETPKDSADENIDSQKTVIEHKRNGSGRVILGGILIIIGLLLLAERFIPAFCFEDIIPLTLVIIGIFLIWNSVSK